MFPTAGYFRSTNCPFFVHGLCHRPYCHFRHSKPGIKASKCKVSPHKHKTDEHKRAEGTSEDQTQHASEDSSSGITHKADRDENLKTTTTVRGILKKPCVGAHQQSDVKVTLDSVDQTTAVTNSSSKDNAVILDGDDTEQPIACLTDEEKQIIGLMSHPPCGSNDLIAVKISGETLSPVSNAASNLNSNILVQTDIVTENESVQSGKHVHLEVNITDTCKETQVAEVKNGSSDNSLICCNDKETITDKIPTVLEQELTGECVVANEEPDKSSSKKRKSVQLKTLVLDVTSTKRKSQQLPCATDCHSPNYLVKYEKQDGEFEKLKGNEDTRKQETVLHTFFKSSSKLLEEIDSATKKSPQEKGSLTKETMSHSPSKRLKLISDSAVAMRQKAPALEAPSNTRALKKKANIAEAEINFFGSTKKASESSKVEKDVKSKDKTPLVKTSKRTQLDARVKERKDFKGKFSKGITILISDDSDTLSVPNFDSSSEEDSHLKRIWNDFEPQNDCVVTKHSPSPSKNQMNCLAEKETSPVAAAVATDVKKAATSLVNTLGLGKKQRVAHTANHLPRRVSSNANPVRRYPKTLASVHKKDEPASCSTSVGSSVNVMLTYKPAKQRVAHVAKNSTPAGSLPRPRIPVEYGAKVPQNQRQRYLDRIIDEYLKLYPTEKQAFEKAVEEEKTLYERSTRRQVYLNLCVNAIKKLRDMTPQDVAASSPIKAATEARVAVTKTLPSGAVVVSTKSPAKQDQSVKPAVDDVTEDVMYDFLFKYLMTEEDLVENGYPRPCPTSPGKAVYKMKKEQPSRDPSRRTCRRCGKPFVVLEDGEYLTREECVYHAGRLFRKRGEQITSYSCCQGDAGSPGCCVGKVHVSDDTYNTDGFMTTILSPLADHRKKIFAMDCEMCYTTAGLELTRITVVNWNLEVVYDTFVIPERAIVDYNTRFSGVTEESLRGVNTTIREVQAVLLSMIHKDTILVGHSLESDLKATKLIHSKVVDTSVVFPHRMGQPYKRALRNLMADHLKKIIQDSVEGHDSSEDAKACLELMRWKVKEDMRRTTRHKSPRLSVG